MAEEEPRFAKHPRQAGLLLLGIGLAACGANWYLLAAKQIYYVKLIVIAPFAVALGLLFTLFPGSYGKDAPGEWWRKALQVAASVAGLGAGALHWYILAH